MEGIVKTRVAASLTSLTPGGFVRARSTSQQLEIGQEVIAFDELGELEVEATVAESHGQFWYLSADWTSARDYAPQPAYWQLVQTITLTTSDVGRTYFVHAQQDATKTIDLVVKKPRFHPGDTVIVDGQWGPPAMIQYVPGNLDVIWSSGQANYVQVQKSAFTPSYVFNQSIRSFGELLNPVAAFGGLSV